jgi:hypothetical protein
LIRLTHEFPEWKKNVLIVDLTSLDVRKENVCILHVGDHPWVRHGGGGKLAPAKAWYDSCVGITRSASYENHLVEAAQPP